MEQIDVIKQPKVPGVVLCRMPRMPRGTEPIGMLWMSAYHIIFSASGIDEQQVVYSAISRVVVRNFGDQGSLLAIELKNFRRVFFYIPVASHATNVLETIECLRKPNTMTWLPAYKPADDANLDAMWSLYDLRKEHVRMGFVGETARDDDWRITALNKDMTRSTTYPSLLVVPSTVEDDVLEVVFKFRAFGRIPTAVYRDSIKNAVLVRCGQPKMPKGKTCYQDAQLMRSIHSACEGKGGFIFDTRASAYASSQIGKAGGTEPTQRTQPYSLWTMFNIGIKQIAALQGSLDRLLDACGDRSLDSSAYWAKVESSGWLEQVRLCLFAAVAGAKTIREDGNPVVVHGSSGYDETCIITSLIQLLLDPFFRTLKGLALLIEKEWLSMGHPFTSRHEQYGRTSAQEKAPIFLLFLDCLHQCVTQFPFCFEFGDELLIDLHSASHNCEYGTFMFDTQLEREAQARSKHFQSFWAQVLSDEGRAKYASPFYEPTCEMARSWIKISFRAQAIDLWEEMYSWPVHDKHHPQQRRRHAYKELVEEGNHVSSEISEALKELQALQAARGLKMSELRVAPDALAAPEAKRLATSSLTIAESQQQHIPESNDVTSTAQKHTATAPSSSSISSTDPATTSHSNSNSNSSSSSKVSASSNISMSKAEEAFLSPKRSNSISEALAQAIGRRSSLSSRNQRRKGSSTSSLGNECDDAGDRAKAGDSVLGSRQQSSTSVVVDESLFEEEDAHVPLAMTPSRVSTRANSDDEDGSDNEEGGVNGATQREKGSRTRGASAPRRSRHAEASKVPMGVVVSSVAKSALFDDNDSDSVDDNDDITSNA